MAYYSVASKKLISWIQSDANREHDFFDLHDVLEGETIEKYLARNAYRSGIILDVIERLMKVETDRIVAKVHLGSQDE